MMPLDSSILPCLKFAAPLMFGVCPNSTGTVRTNAGAQRGWWGHAGSGAFAVQQWGDTVVTANQVSSTESTATGLSFDLSRSSGIFSGSKMQPSALQTLACIRC